MRDMKEREEAQRRQMMAEREEIERQRKEMEQGRNSNPPPMIAQGSMRMPKNTSKAA
jgi:hypothetical protein